MPLSGAQALFRALEDEGVEIVFGIPGGAIMPAYDALLDSPIRHVLMRHEQGAGHAAEGYAQASGRVGVCMTTSGPGATNLVTPLADAMMDSIPLVAITGQVARSSMGRQAFQEAPITEITRPITKGSWLVMDPERVEATIHEAFALARSGRPGPVLVDIPKDVQAAVAERSGGWTCPACPPPPVLAERELRRAADLILAARRPVLYVGGGVVRSGAEDELFDLALKQQLPVVTTLMARGAFPDSHPLALGMPGMHGAYAAVMAMQRSDLLVAIGARFDDRVTGRLDAFAPEARVIHVDIDPAEIGKNRVADVALVGDARRVLVALGAVLPGFEHVIDPSARRAWLTQLDRWRERFCFRYRTEPGVLKPQQVVERLWALTRGEAVVVTGVGQHQMWTSQLWRFDRPRSWLTSGGLGTMGFALPAAVGAKAARPDQLVLAIDGDGCFQMTCQELAPTVTERLPLLVCILNNGGLGMVRQWQELFFRGRLSQVHLDTEVPDVVALARAYGCAAYRVERPEEVDGVIDAALAEVAERTTVVEFRVSPTENCFPIVPAGASNEDILLGDVIGLDVPSDFHINEEGLTDSKAGV
jgi:acetolactate synthase-1/2/3 large subunit